MNRIELLIKEKGYNMTSFAEKMNTTRQNLYAILKSPSYPTLEKVAEALDVPMPILSPALTAEVKYISMENHVCQNIKIYEGKNTINKE